MLRRGQTKLFYEKLDEHSTSEIKGGTVDIQQATSDKENNHVGVHRKSKSIHFEEPVWRKRLSDQIEEVEEAIAKKRRYNPWMTPAELDFVMKIWSQLEQRLGQGIQSEQATRVLAEEVGLSTMRINAILEGDPRHQLSEQNKLEVIQQLEVWLQQQLELTDDKSKNDMPVARARRRSETRRLPAADAFQNTTNLTKATVTTSARGRKSRSCSPIPSSSCKKQEDMSTTTRKRRLSHSLHSSTSSLSSRETSSKRAARPSYEPPSVKRRKLRQSGRLSMVQHVSTKTSDSLSRRKSGLERTSFCPIEASKQKILSEIKKLRHEDNKANKNMELEHLELSMKVWDDIVASPEQKVEAAIARIASKMDMSHLRLTRFLRGDRDNLLSREEATMIARKLKEWLNKV